MVAFDFILVFVFLVLAVQLLADRIKGIGFTVQTVQIKLISHDTISVLVKDWSFPKLVMLENQILQCSTIGLIDALGLKDIVLIGWSTVHF